MNSPYFHGGKPKADAPKKRVPLPPSLNPEGDTRFTKSPPARRVLVRTHTRAAPTRKSAKQKPVGPVETVRPASHLQDIPTPPVGSPPAARRHWEKVTGRKLPPEGTARKPGPVGDEKSQLNAAQLVAAQRAGVRPTVAMKALEQTVHPLTDLSQQALGVKPFNVGGAVSDVANIGANFVPVGKAAGILGGLRGLKGLKGLKAAKEGAAVGEAAKAVEPAAKKAATSARRPEPRVFPVARAYEGGPYHPVGAVEDYYRLMPKGEHLYHSTSADQLERIRHEGLKPGKTRQNEITGVYFAEDGTDVTSLRPAHARKGDVILRVKRSNVSTEVTDMFEPGSGFAEHVSRGPVRPEHLEYLGADNRWHPLTGGRRAVPAGPIAEEAAALRGAVSGQPAKAALKAMTPAEKAGAKLDNPNLGKSVRQLQKEQKQLYSQERARRAAAAQVHLSNQALAPDERIRLAKHELKGELPKIKFQGFTELSDEAVTAMQKHILDHPTLMPYQKITASTAMTNALTGKLPTPSELKLLEHVFGKDTTAGLGSIAKHPLKDTILGVLNVPRSIMASFDLSAPFRQGLVVATRHPKIFVRNFKPMVKAFGSEKVYQAALDEIQARPTYPLMMEAKLSLTNLGHAIGEREEQFASNIAETLTGGKRSPIRASGRAYTGFLDKTRADVFDHLIQRAQTQGLNVHDPTFLKSLGTYINSATGRGDLGAFQEAGKVLNAVFFSPRLLASRLNFLNPLYYKRLDPFARKEALRSAVQLAGTLSTLLTLASRIPGVNVVTDPRNPDWGKIKVGNTRIDIAGGFQQHLRLFAQLATGVAISSTTGKKLNLTADQFGNPTRLDLLLRFFEGKEAPIASFATDFLRGSNQVGEKFDVRKEAVQRMLPLLAQDSYDLYRERHGGLNGLAAAFAGYAVGSVGLGMQTYGPRPSVSTKKPQSYFAPATSGGSPYFSPSSSGDSGYFGSP